MKFFRTFTSGASLLALLATGAVSQAHAQSGSFDLPVQAHWGSVVLSPGHYKYSVPDATSWPQLIMLHKDGRTVKLAAAYEQINDVKPSSELVIKQANGAAVVTDLNFGPQGKSFHFAVPKVLCTQVASNGKASGKIVTLVPKS